MAVLPLLIDCEVPTTSQDGTRLSLLSVPVGTGSLLDEIAYWLQSVPGTGDREIMVMPSFPVDECTEEAIRQCAGCRVRVVRAESLSEVLHNECEVGDYVLAADPRRWPLGGFDLAGLLRRHGDYRAATHVIGVGSNNERARERVAHDTNGQVRRVQRLYEGVAWPDVAGTGIFLSLVPAWPMRDTAFACLGELRSALAARGILSRDLPLRLDVCDLTQADDLVAFNAEVLARETERAPVAGFSVRRGPLLVGRGCRVHPSARFAGPVALHEGVEVGEGAMVIGPCVVGRESELAGGSVVAQSVLAPRTKVQAGATVRHCLAAGRQSASAPACAPIWGPTRLRVRRVSSTRGGSVGGSGRGAGSQRRTVHFAVKRTLDVVLSLLGLLVLSPLLVTVALVIKLTSPGPVLFMHRRERKGGKEFSCFKFRTMTVDAHRQQRDLYKQNEVDGPQFKLSHDPRVTRVGRWVRATNIDELPQLINVLLGHMSLVGPRPSPFRENQICVPWRRARLSVRPGISGLWQICRSKRAGGDFHQWIYYDIAYVRHFSVWLDLKILLATVLTSGGRWSVPMSWLVREEDPSGEWEPRQTLAA